MKFGKSIGTQQEGNVELHYVDYNTLKKSIKDVVACQQASQMSEALFANTAFEEELAAEISQVNNCFWRRQQELLQRTADLSEMLQSQPQARAGASSSSASSSSCAAQAASVGDAMGSMATRGASSSSSRPSPEAPESLGRLVDIMGEVDRLRRYAVWNAVAVVKILKKRRKQTSLGIEDPAAERAGWLQRQNFFSGSDFAELHAAVESLGHLLVRSEICADGRRLPSQPSRAPEQCPICLDEMVDMVELSCSHKFCWKCFVLGPIAFQPGEYRMSQCPICRKETVALDAGQNEEEAAIDLASFRRPERELTRFLHTYFPVDRAGEGSGSDAEKHMVGEHANGEQEDNFGDGVRNLMKALLEGETCKTASGAEAQDTALQVTPAAPDDFFQTLPPPQRTTSTEAWAQKLSWLQLASTGDPLALDDTMYCSLCSEPLLLEAVVTTPCKHSFHRVCLRRLELPECPLCSTALPFSWFLPEGHPCTEHGFKVIPAQRYHPRFAGGPSSGSGGFPLHRPPPMELLGPDGFVLKSYLHRAPPMGPERSEVEDQDADREEEVEKRHTNAARAVSPDRGAEGDDDESESSSESGSDEEAQATEELGTVKCVVDSRFFGSEKIFAYSAVGRMRLLDRCRIDEEMAACEVHAANKEVSTQMSQVEEPVHPPSQPVTLSIGDHL